MSEKTAGKKDRFVLIGHRERLFFPDDCPDLYVADNYDLDLRACFIPLPRYLKLPGEPSPGEGQVYLAVRFPESQLFMEEHRQEIYLITGEHCIEGYGHAAYFVEERLYEKVRAEFEREISCLPSPGLNLS